MSALEEPLPLGKPLGTKYGWLMKVSVPKYRKGGVKKKWVPHLGFHTVFYTQGSTLDLRQGTGLMCRLQGQCNGLEHK